MDFCKSFLSGCALLVISASLFAAEPVSIVPPEFVSYPRQPQVAVDDAGQIFIAFGAGETVYVCRSSDGGKSYAIPVEVGRLPKLALGMRRGPRVSASKNEVVVSAISHESGDLVAWSSRDGAKTWSEPVLVNDSPRVAREGLHAMALGPQGMLCCAWLDLRNNKTQIYGASSIDGGRSWTENRRIYASPSGTVCECCHPSIAFDSDGAIYVMWRNVLDGNRDMFIAASDAKGTTFGPALKLGLGSWKLDACPMDGGFLAVAAQGQLSTVWRRGKQVFLFEERPQSKRFEEHRLGTGEQPWAAATSNGVMVVWLSRRGGDLWLQNSTEGESSVIAQDATDPVIAAQLTGSGPVVVAWETGKKPNTSIVAKVLSE